VVDISRDAHHVKYPAFHIAISRDHTSSLEILKATIFKHPDTKEDFACSGFNRISILVRPVEA
jgi:hypothetical protein